MGWWPLCFLAISALLSVLSLNVFRWWRQEVSGATESTSRSERWAELGFPLTPSWCFSLWCHSQQVGQNTVDIMWNIQLCTVPILLISWSADVFSSSFPLCCDHVAMVHPTLVPSLCVWVSFWRVALLKSFLREDLSQVCASHFDDCLKGLSVSSNSLSLISHTHCHC